MIKKENLDKTNAWPFVEAKKMLRERKTLIEKKGKIILQTGYGPSGLPHIGTFAEVARTSMMVNALKQLTDVPTEIITFSLLLNSAITFAKGILAPHGVSDGLSSMSLMYPEKTLT